jgi:peptidoglycan hydrolase-like protein with peptidoglycan-binding domain
MARILPSMPGQPPIIDPEIENIIPKQENVAGEINKPIEQEGHQDAIHSESHSRSAKSELGLSGMAQQTQLNQQVGVLGVGSRGPQVQELQNKLNNWRAAHNQPPIAADGVFGKETEAALKTFQESTGQKADGLAGPKVNAALNRVTGDITVVRSDVLKTAKKEASGIGEQIVKAAERELSNVADETKKTVGKVVETADGAVKGAIDTATKTATGAAKKVGEAISDIFGSDDYLKTFNAEIA